MNDGHSNGAVAHPPELSWLCRYLSERSPQATIALEGPRHIVVYLNPAFAKFVRKPAGELLGRPFAEAIPEGAENGCLAMLDRVLGTGISESLTEQSHRDPAGTPTWWSYLAWAVPGADERQTGVLLQLTDDSEIALFRASAAAMNEALLISSVRQHELAEVAESLSERLQASVRTRDHFIATLSHELRNPLAPLVAGVQLLKRATPDPVVSESVRVMMERQLKQMVRLVDDLLDVNRITLGKLRIREERVELASVIRDAVDACRALVDHNGQQLTVELPRDPIVLWADPIRLTQVFSNLLTNASRYSQHAGQILLSAARDGDEVVVTVRDDGIGIPADRLQQIFECFVQLDETWKHAQGGLGIGLSLVGDLVALHGGRVEAYSEGVGAGSAFVVRLPVTAAVLPARVRLEETRGQSRRVLVVDDNRDAVEMLALFLEMGGHEVRTAADGVAAVEVGALFHPEVILMDIGMPRMDGYEAARRVRAAPWGRECLLVALTGWGSDEDRRLTHDAGFDQHVVKPVDPAVLEALIAELTSGRTRSPLTPA